MAWTEQDYQEIVARLMANSIGVNEVPNADKADDVTSLPAFKPSGSNSEASVVNYPLEFLKGEQGEPGIQGEPGKSFKVAGEYDTLEALKSAVPDGSAVDGFMAVGTEAPYDYYAWVSSAGGNNPNPSPDGKYLLLSDGTPLLLANEEPILLADSGERVASNGEWVSQGKIGGIDEAPTDGKAYGRKNGDWAEVSDKKYVDDSISSARSVGYMMQLTEIDASGLDENTWYPVTIAAGERMNIRVEVLVSLDSGTKPSWSTHERGFSTRKIWEFAPYAWGVNRDSKTTIYLSDFLHTDIDPVRGLGNLSHFDTCYVFVRGGGKYHFYASHEAKVILHTDTYAPGDQSVSPTTETPAEIVANIATKEYADNIGYGKVIDVDGNDSINNINAQGTEAENRINRLFGSINSFKNVVIDIVNSHAKYHFHLFNLTSNCIEMGSVFAYVSSSENNRHLLSFIFTYLDYCKHCKIDVTDVSKEVIIKDLVASDNLTTLTKKTAAEYEAIGSKDANTAYCVTD
jgi:hypothetical protein